jgi:hypothetical protein
MGRDLISLLNLGVHCVVMLNLSNECVRLSRSLELTPLYPLKPSIRLDVELAGDASSLPDFVRLQTPLHRHLWFKDHPSRQCDKFQIGNLHLERSGETGADLSI